MTFPLLRFRDIVQDKSGGNQKLPKEFFLPQGQYPVIDQGKKFIAGYIDDKDYLVKSTDLPVVVFGDHTKAIKFVDFPFVMGADGVKVLKPKAECDTKYLYHYLRYAKIPDAGYSRHYKFLKELEIPLPALSKQRRIASILDEADELRQKRQQTIEKLDQLLQATFIDMFGDPVSNPKGWDVKKLSELSTKIHSGNTPKGGSENYVDKGIIFLRSQNVWKNKVILDDVAYIDAETHAKMMKSSVKHEDLLMTKTGRINTENSSLGRAAIYLGEDDSANINGHVYL